MKNDRLARVLSALALLAATLAAFAGVRANGWVLIDDPIYVTENTHVTGGLSWQAFAWFLHAPHGGNWHPLTSLSHLLDVTLFGLSPAGPHVENLLLHALNALLLLFVLNRMTGAWWRPLAVAALFALHPLRVESVAWISERKDVLSGAFFLLTLLAYQRWTARPSAGRYAAVCGALALGLASKPMLVTVPAVLLLLDVWPLQRLPLTTNALRDGTLATRLREKLAPFLIACAFAVVTYAMQRGTGAMTDGSTLPLATRAGNALLSVCRYAGRSLWPVHLGVFYPYSLPLALPAVAMAALGIAAVSAFAWRARNDRPWLLVGWLWFLGMLLPVIGLVQVGRQSWADRYSYLPTIGLAIIVVWGASALAAKRRFAQMAIVAAMLMTCTALGVASSRQVARWRNSETLFAWTARVVPNNLTALMGLGNAYMKRDRPDLAVTPFQQAHVIDSRNSEVRDRLVIVLMRLQRYDEALRLAPADVGLLLQSAWRHATSADATVRDGALAVQQAEHARAVEGKADAILEATLAAAYAEAGRWTDAIAAGERAVKLARAQDANREVALFSAQLALYRRHQPMRER